MSITYSGESHSNGTTNGAPYPPLHSEADFGPQSPYKPTPKWRDREPRFVHSLKWLDAEGIEHLHVVRSDDLDDVLKEVRTVKAFIAASRSAAPEPAPNGSTVSADVCLEHHAKCTRKGDVWLHKAGEVDGKAIWCRRKIDGGAA